MRPFVERESERERREGGETYAYLNIQIVALIYEMWQKQKAKKEEEYRTCPILRICDRNNVWGRKIKMLKRLWETFFAMGT